MNRPGLLLSRIAFRNLFRNGRRNLLTGTSITFGFVGVALLGAYILRMERYLATQSVYLGLNGHVIVYAKDGLDRHLAEPGKYSLDERAQKVLRDFGDQDPRVARVSPLLQATGLIHNGCVSFPFSALGAPAETVAWARAQEQVAEHVPELAHVARGRGYWELPDSESPVNFSPRLAAILGKEKVFGDEGAENDSPVYDCDRAEDRARLRNDPHVQLLGTGFDGGLALADATIAGWVSSGMAFQDDTALLMPFATAQRTYQTEKATAETFYLKRERDIPAFVRDLEARLKAEGVAADVYPFSSEKISPFYVGGMQFNWIMLYLFFALVCSVVAISISNSLYISLVERKAELGTLLAVGFRPPQILLLLLLEHAFLLAACLAPGLALTFLARATLHVSNIRLLIPGLSSDIQFRLHLTPTYLTLVATLLLALVLLVTRAGTRRFLRRSILDLLGAAP